VIHSTARDELLSRLQTRIAAQEKRIARLERRRSHRRAFALVALLVALVPAGLLAANPFTDLTGGVHDANIDAIYTAGVTTGCVPNAQFCPKDNVTREEMASFLARLGGLGTNPPVANARTLGGRTPGDLIRAAAGEPSQEEVTLTSNVNDGFVPWNTLSAVTVNAPAAGFLLVSGSVSVGTTSDACDGGSNGTKCMAFIRLRHTAAGGVATLPVFAVVNRGGGGNAIAMVTPVALIPVPAGAATVVVEGAGNAGSVNLVGASVRGLTALFVPFDGMGKPPTP
jgi:hypothetical protein